MKKNEPGADGKKFCVKTVGTFFAKIDCFFIEPFPKMYYN